MNHKLFFWIALFATYFLMHVLIRLSFGDALGIDEAQIFVHAQSLEWGYGPQPPLYAWLQFGAFHIFGETLFALSLLKNSLLFLMILCWLTLFRKHWGVAMAGLAVCAFIFVPQFSWESQRALTHSVIAGTMTAVTYLVFWSLLVQQKASVWRYVLLGAVIAAGVLSKPTYLLVPIAILCATFSLRDLRGKLSLPRLALSAVVSLLLCLPYLLWSVENAEATLSSARKFEMATEAAFIVTAVQGILSYLLAIISFMLLPALVLGGLWVFGRAKSTPASASLFTNWLLRSVAFGLVLILVIVLVSQSTNVKDRWLQAVMMPLTPVLAYMLLTKLSVAARRWYVALAITCACLVAVGQPVHNLQGNARRAAPFEQLTPQIADFASAHKPIIAADWVAGNLGIKDPDLHFAKATEMRRNVSYAVVWIASNPPEWLAPQQGLYQLGASVWNVSQVQSFSAPYQIAKDQSFELFAVQLTPERD